MGKTILDKINESALAAGYRQAAELAEESRIGGALAAFFGSAAKACRGSVLCRPLFRGNSDVLARKTVDSMLLSPFGAAEDTAADQSVLLTHARSVCAGVSGVYRRMFASRWVQDSSLFGAATALSRHFAVWMLLFLAALFAAPHAYWNNLYGVMGVFALLALFLVAYGAGIYQRIRLRPLGLALPLWVAWTTASLFWTASLTASLRFYLFFISGFILALLLVNTIKRTEALHSVVVVLVLGSAFCALYGFYTLLTGSIEIQWGQTDFATTGGAVVLRIPSVFGNPNSYSQYILMVLPFCAALWFNTKSKMLKAVYIVIAGLSVLAMLLTYSRLAWIGMVCAAVLYAALFNWRTIAPVLLGGLVAIPFLPHSLFMRFTSIFAGGDSSLNSRSIIFDTLQPILKDYVWTGTGVGAVQSLYPGYDMSMWPIGKTPAHIHNTYLQILLETGVIGLAIWLAALISLVKRSLLCFFNGSCPVFYRHVIAAGLSGLFSLLIISFGEYVFFYPRVFMLYFIVTGLLLTAVSLGEKKGDANGDAKSGL